jgi:hypothetical protein
MIKTIMLAAAAMSVLALHTQSASAQATPVYGSPAQAKTANDVLSAPRLNRVMRERRGFEPFAAAPRAYQYNQPATSWDKHTRDISAY